MKSVIISFGASSAVLYVQECWERGLEPIIVNSKELNRHVLSFETIVGHHLRHFEISDDAYCDVIEELRRLDPVAVVCGAGGGVELTDRMARDLGLKGNDPETTYMRDTKDGMQEAIRKAGLRYVRTAIIKCREDIEAFWNGEKLDKAIFKYANGSGSVGNKICNSLKEALEHYGSIANGKNMFGRSDKVLLQEFIDGTEYVVDTVSCEGKHVVTDIWKYVKIKTKDGNTLYDETSLVVTLQPDMLELIQYAYRVLDATGFEYGPCHGEFMVDDKGPVLIETNPRPHGGTLIAKYLDECQGNHITDVALDAYLAPDNFLLWTKKLYRPRKHALMKTINSPLDCNINPVFLRKILEHLGSFRYCVERLDLDSMHVSKAVDLETALADIKMCNSDYEQLRKDSDLITLLETEYFDVLSNGDMVIGGADVQYDPDEFLHYFLGHRKMLIITASGSYSMHYGSKTAKIDAGGYDGLLYADASGCTVAERFESIIVAAERLCDGGTILVLDEVYRNLPHGRATVAMALCLAGCTIEMPFNDVDCIVATMY